MSADSLDQQIAACRRFSRFFTRQIGLLDEGYLDSPFRLGQVRVLYELAQRQTTTASELGRELGLDAGYLSRLLAGFERDGLIERSPSPLDGRQSLVRLSERGRQAFAPLDARSHQRTGELLAPLAEPQRRQLVAAMGTIERLLGERAEPRAPYLLRPPRAGDFGWVVHRHGLLYAREYGWDERFEALVAGIVGQFVEQYEPRRERCWIAERDGEPVGSVFVVQGGEQIAKLRLLLVEPEARGLGIGRRLVDECIQFARSVGYRTLKLWTNSNLLAARQIYAKAGFQLVEAEPHHSFGHDLVGETWELAL